MFQMLAFSLALNAVSALVLPLQHSAETSFQNLEPEAKSVLLNALTPKALDQWEQSNNNTLPEAIASVIEILEISLPKSLKPLTSKQQVTKLYKHLFTAQNGEYPASKLCLPMTGYRVRCIPPP